MRIGGSAIITHPSAAVFAALRDRQLELVPFLPNIEAIEVLERREEPPLTHLRNRWQGSNAEVPAVLRPFVSRELMAWYDEAVWNAETLSCRWSLHSTRAREIFSCAGTTSVVGEGDQRCAFRLEGELGVRPEKIPGVPGLLARRVREPLETFVANLLRPNLTRVATAVQQYLDGASSRA